MQWANDRARLVHCANEGDAVAVCAGLYLAGRESAFFCQNSGLGNAVSPLTSLAHTFETPLLGFVSLRGDPAGVADEPQHELMGRATCDLLTLLEVRWMYLPENTEEIETAIKAIQSSRAEGKSFVFVVRQNLKAVSEIWDSPNQALGPDISQEAGVNRTQLEPQINRVQAIGSILEAMPLRSVVVATTGYTSRELAQLYDNPAHFYMVGSMGCASSIGLGLALGRPDVNVVVLDGDGALLMRMGASAALTLSAPPNLTHILLNNRAHESTGGQPTTASAIDFPLWARALGYRSVYEATTAAEIRTAITQISASPVLSFVHVPIAQGSIGKLARPQLAPPQVAKRFRAHIVSL